MKDVTPLDIKKIFTSIKNHRKVFFYSLPISFISACLLILCVPRYYICSVSMAPEILNTNNTSSISSIASSFGVNLSDKLGAMSDAFYPEIYPDILNTTSFRLNLLSIPVKTKDGSVKTSYGTYIDKYQKYPWWTKAIGWIKETISSKDNTSKNGNKINPFMLTKKQTDIIDAIGDKINCSIDKKTQIIAVTVKDQDPLICAVIADSVRCKLQKFITDYRTSKARADMEYTHKLLKEAKKQYEKSRQRYSSFSDSNFDALLTSVNSKRDDYENQMQLEYNNYSNLANQYQSAIARVQERTPAFTILQPACVPVKPAGPKRMYFVLIVVLLTLVGSTIYSIIKDQKE